MAGFRGLFWISIFFSVNVTLIYAIRLGAFNIERWGSWKKGRDEIRNEVLPQIVGRYDLVLLQEVMDPQYLTNLKNELNRRGGQYDHCISKAHVSSKNYQEHYGFLYRKTSFINCDEFQYSGTSVFERPPYAVVCHRSNAAPSKFGFLGIHTKPTQKENEWRNLYNAYLELNNTWQGLKDNIIIGGDLNIGYYPLSRYMQDLNRYGQIFNTSRFRWEISDNTPTMVSTPYAHDRFILGKGMWNSIKYGPDAPVPFHFPSVVTYNGNLLGTKAKKVSDHLPIELNLK